MPCPGPAASGWGLVCRPSPRWSLLVATCPAATPGAPYYAEAFLPLLGRCFRLVASQDEAGPGHCPGPVVWRGSWRAPDGRRYRIEACEGHRPAPTKAAAQPPSLAAGRRGGRPGAGTPGRLATRPHRPRARSSPHCDAVCGAWSGCWQAGAGRESDPSPRWPPRWCALRLICPRAAGTGLAHHRRWPDEEACPPAGVTPHSPAAAW